MTMPSSDMSTQPQVEQERASRRSLSRIASTKDSSVGSEGSSSRSRSRRASARQHRDSIQLPTSPHPESPLSRGPSNGMRRRFSSARHLEINSTLLDDHSPMSGPSSPSGSSTRLSFKLGADSDIDFNDAPKSPLPHPPKGRSPLSETLHSDSNSSIEYGFGVEPSLSAYDESSTLPQYDIDEQRTHSAYADSRTTSDEHRGQTTNSVHRTDSDAHLHPQPPTKVNLHNILTGYKLQRTLGEGAFAKVKEAVHRASGVKVAVKVVYKKCITADYVRDNLQREGNLLRLVNHPHVIKLIEIIETDEIYCLVTEIASGGELLDYIVAHNTLKEKEAQKYTRQLIEAVLHIHSLDIVHRDLKTENLLLDNNFDLKVVDFGLSNSIAGKTTLETMCGSPAYTAPELLGGKQYGKPVDVWSIGINLYAMLTGKLPFSSDNVTVLHAMILDQDFHMPERFSEELQDLLLKILVAKPKKRITLDDLRKHPWVCKGGLDPVPEPAAVEAHSNSYNNQVLDFMVEKLGHDRYEIVEAIDNKDHDPLHATYLLLEIKLKRKGYLASPMKKEASSRLARSSTELAFSRRNVQQALHTDDRIDSIPEGRRAGARGGSRRKSVSTGASRVASRKSSATGVRGQDREPTSPLERCNTVSVPNSSSASRRSSQASMPSRKGSFRKNHTRTETDVMADELRQEDAARTRLNAAVSLSRGTLGAPRRRQSFHFDRKQAGVSRAGPFSAADDEEAITDVTEMLTPSRQRSGSARTASRRMRTTSTSSNGDSFYASSTASSKPRRASLSGAHLRPSTSTRGSDTLPSIQSPTSNPLAFFKQSSKSPRTSISSSTAATSATASSLSSGKKARQASVDKRFQNIRTLRVPLSKSLLSQKRPKAILQEVERAVGTVGLPYSVSFNDGVCVVARTESLSIEIELIRVAGLQVHSLHFSRLRGEPEEYTALYTQLLEELCL